MASNDTVVHLGGDIGPLATAMEDAANAVRDASRLIQEQTAAMAARAQGHAETVANSAKVWRNGMDDVTASIGSVSSGLDRARTVASSTALAMDAIGFVPASTAATALAGRIDEVATVTRVLGEGSSFLADQIGGVGDGADYASALLTDYQRAAVQAEETQAGLNAEVEDGYNGWLIAAGAAAAAGAVIYGAYALIEEGASLAGDGLSAVADGVGQLVAADLAGRFTAPAIEAAAAAEDLAREMGFAAEHLANLGDVASAYQVSQDDATAAMRRMAEILDNNTDKTKEAREVLKAYGVQLDGLTGQDWASVLDAWAKSMNGYADSARKAADVQAVLGNDGAKWLKGIASGAGEASHAATEADRVLAVVAHNIAESNKRIEQSAPHGWLDGFLGRLDRAISRSDDFKAKQEYAASHAAIAWNEFGQMHEGWLTDVGKLWDGLIASASDYIALASGDLVVPQIKDGRPQVPTAAPRYTGEPVQDKTVEHLDDELNQMKMSQENWLTWRRSREVAFYQQRLTDLKAELMEEMGAEEATKHKTYQAVNAKLQTLLREQAREEQDLRLQGMRSEQEAAGKNLSAKLAAARAYAEAVKEAKGAESRDYQQAAQEIVRLEQTASEQTGRIREIGVEATRKSLEQEVELKREAVRRDRELGKISEADQIAALRSLDEQKFEGDLKASQHRLELARQFGGGEIETVRRIEQEITDLRNRAALTREKSLTDEMASRRRETLRAGMEEIDLANVLANDLLESERSNLSFRREIGEIGEAEEIQGLMRLKQEETRINMEGLRQKLATGNLELAERRRITGEISRLESRHARDMRRLQQQAVVANRNLWRGYMQPINSAISSSIQGMIMGTTTLRAAMANLGQSVVASFLDMGLHMVSDWAANKLAMIGWTKLLGLVEEETAAETAIASAAAGKAAAASNIAAQAGVGAAAAMASVAAIPYVGWAMAPAVGAEHFALAMGYSASLASAEGGWERVPYDGAMTELHKDEMVLPAYIAGPLRNMVGEQRGWGLPPGLAPQMPSLPETSASASGPVTINVPLTINSKTTMTDAEMKSALLRHQRTVAQAAANAKNNGFGLGKA